MDNSKTLKLVGFSVVVAVILNIVLALGLSSLATKEQIKPANGAQNLNFFSQIMHMLVHHKQVLFTSSLIVAVLIALSVFLAIKISNSYE